MPVAEAAPRDRTVERKRASPREVFAVGGLGARVLSPGLMSWPLSLTKGCV